MNKIYVKSKKNKYGAYQTMVKTNKRIKFLEKVC